MLSLLFFRHPPHRVIITGKNLRIHVVHLQLLEFFRSRLRETFSSIMQKRIYMFHFDRSSKIDSQIFQKFQNAIFVRLA